MIKLWLSTYIRYIEWGVLVGSWIAVAWATHHIDGLAVKAAKQEHTETVANSLPEVITKTQVITKVIHDSQDKCAATVMPPALLEQLR